MLFASVCKLHVNAKKFDSRTMAHLTSSATRTCGIGEIRQFCQLQAEGQSLMRSAMSQLQLSARAYHRTIADLAGSEEILSSHLAEALQYRPKIMIG